MRSVIFVFLDGFGLGSADANNPLFTKGIPIFEIVAGGKLIAGIDICRNDILIKGIDATLGVDGTPQSATGQTALMTGLNAQKILGYHLPAFPNNQLVELIAEHNILKRIKDAGLRTTFANSYSKEYFDKVKSGRAIHSVTTHCMLSAELPIRTMDDLINNNAVTWDITREYAFTNIDPHITTIDPFSAGVHLAGIASHYELVLFESFKTDLIGHKCDRDLAQKMLTILDQFFSGILKTKSDSTNLIVCSDHGNIEDLSTGGHTSNMVPLIVIGPDAQHFKNVERIDQVTPEILELFAIK